MPLIHLILTAFIALLFLGAVFILSWYIALPLIIVWAVWGSCRWIRDQFISYRLKREANGCTIRRTQNRPRQTTVIDVDYTEIN